MQGRTLGHYRVEARLGEGGMGVVYRAVDTRLNRPVALKLLHAEAMADPERKKRFVQEAQAASALNHPNIITIYDIDTASTSEGPVDFIAMEYVDGKTLDRLIGRKGFSLGEVLRCSTQIADALATAHGAGIVHRDLKPANIMVTEKGLVKVLDFGLAKLTEKTDSDELAPTETLKAPRTEEGTILGTVAYMSPEQAEGKRVDARSDIFSFGAVLYEMLTGQRPFRGETKISTLSAILHQEPKSLAELLAGAPHELERIVGRCLRKDPGRRFQQMEEVRLALEELKEESESGKLTAAVAAPGKPRRRWAMALAAAAGLTMVVALWWFRRPQALPTGPVLTRLTSDAGLTTEPALSPDGKLVAYASDRAGRGSLDIWVQQVAGGDPIQVTRDDADEREPAFSPDGSQLTFTSWRGTGEVYVVSTLGGAARKIASPGRRPRFSPDGRWIAYWTGAEVDLSAPGQVKTFVVPANGGEPRQFQPGFATAAYPTWAPDGKHLLFLGMGEPKGELLDWWVAPLEDGRAVRTGALPAIRQQKLAPPITNLIPGEWAVPGDQVLFSARLGDSTNLWQIPISPANWQARGAAQRLTSGSGQEMLPSSGASRVVFSSLTSNIDIWSLTLDLGQGKALGPPQRLTEDAGVDIHPSFSADGRKMAFVSSRSGKRNVWIKDLDTGKESPLTANLSVGFRPILSPDGSRVTYPAYEETRRPLYVVPASGGVARKICEDCGALWDWSADGQDMLIAALSPKATRTVGLFRPETGERAVILAHPEYNLYVPRFSPDGRWVSFAGNTGAGVIGRWFRAPFRGTSAVSLSEWVSEPEVYQLWSPDGRFRFFLSWEDGFPCLWSRRVDPNTQQPLSPPLPVQHFHSARRSPFNVQLAELWISLASNRLAFPLGEITGNIWMAEWK
jgi:Tol biopolymer transport system component/predicted Ser/Thr protein kinase